MGRAGLDTQDSSMIERDQDGIILNSNFLWMYVQFKRMLAHVGNVDYTILLIQLCNTTTMVMIMQEKIPSLVWNRKMIQSYLRCNKHEGYQFSSDWWNAAV